MAIWEKRGSKAKCTIQSAQDANGLFNGEDHIELGFDGPLAVTPSIGGKFFPRLDVYIYAN